MRERICKPLILVRGFNVMPSLQFRYILEPEIAALAAQSIDGNDLLLIQTILDAQVKDLPENKDDALEDQRFHIAPARATKNQIMGEVFALLYERPSWCPSGTFRMDTA
jgi:DNA-binding FadR family transcriptional regulator